MPTPPIASWPASWTARRTPKRSHRTLSSGLEKLSTFRGDCRFSTWLYRIAYRLALRRARTPRTEQTVDDERLWESLSDDVPLPLLDESEATDDQVERLRQALDRLRPDERVLLMLTYDEERPAAEVATIMGLSEGNIRTRLCRLRKKLFILLNHDSEPR